MSSALDKALDEIVQDKTSNGGNRRPNQRRRGNFRSRSSGPRDGVSKSSRGPRDPGRGNWAHDKYDESDHSSSHRDRGRRGDGGPPPHRASTKVRVEQLHYDIGEKDLNDVFSRVGNIVKLEILYDRAGRSEGVAYVTYSTEDEAELAIDQFDGANAHGQPISVKLANARGSRGGDRGGGGGSGGFGNESNPLFDRIKPRDSGDASADEESRRAKRSVAELRENAQTLNIDRYIPGDRGNSRDRRGGQRRGGGGGGRGNERERRGGGRDRERRAGSAGASAGGESRRGGGGSGGSRPKKTVEELDAEMNSYWGTSADTGAAAAPTEGSAPAAAAENPPAQQQQATNVPTTNVTNFDEEMTDL